MEGRGQTLTSDFVAKEQAERNPPFLPSVVKVDVHAHSGLRKRQGGNVRVRHREKAESVSLKAFGNQEYGLKKEGRHCSSGESARIL